MKPLGNPLIFHQYPLEEAFRLMAKFGFRRLEIAQRDIEACCTDELRGQLVRHARSLGLTIVRYNIAGQADYFTPLKTRKDGKGIVAGLKKDIDIAHSLGVTELLTWEGRTPKGAKRREIHGWILNETIAIFREAVAYGKAKGVSILVEVHPFTLGIDLDFLVKLCDAVDSDYFGVAYDCCHFGVGLPADYIKAIARLGPRIKAIHFSDSDQRSSELHFAVGRGCLDLDGIVRGLKQIRFKGTIMLDLWLYPFPEEGTRESLPYISRAMKTLGIAT